MKVEVIQTAMRPSPTFPYLAERNGRLILVGREAVVYLDTGEPGVYPTDNRFMKDFGFTVKLIQE